MKGLTGQSRSSLKLDFKHSAQCKILLRTMQTAHADSIAAILGLQRVGIIFNQSVAEKDYILNDQEIQQMCEMQHSVGESCVTAVFSLIEEDGHVRLTPDMLARAVVISKKKSVICSGSWSCAERSAFGGISVL